MKANVFDFNGKEYYIYILPDGGNRAKCILRDDIFFKLYPKGELEPVEDTVTTAVRGGTIQLLGTSKEPVEFFFANHRYFYKTKPLIVKNFVLPCLLSATDLKNMNAKIDYSKNLVHLGTRGTTAKLVPYPQRTETEIGTIQKSTIYPGTEAIIPIRTHDLLSGHEMLVLPNEKFEQETGLICIASVNPVRPTGLAHVKVINLQENPVTIRSGTTIGTASIAKVEQKTIATTSIANIEQKQRTEPMKANKMPAKDTFMKKIYEDLNLKENDYLNNEQKNELTELLYEYRTVIARNLQDIGGCDAVKCHIPTEPGRSVKASPRPLPPNLKENLREQLDAWLQTGVIEPAPPGCPFSSPMVPVKKKNGQIRWAVDYRELNKITYKDHRPIPNILEKLSSLKVTERKPLNYFGTVDLTQAFHHIAMDEESKLKTAITTPLGLFCFRRMPFGLHGAPQAFSELIRILESNIEQNTSLAKQILIYFDDALICGSTWEEFLTLMRVFLEQCRRMNLKINPKKCSLGNKSTKWLGHELSNKGIAPAKELTQTIENWPTPTSVADLRSLFGTFSYYRRFIPNFAQRTLKMRTLLQKDVPFHWTKEHTMEMNDLKNSLCSTPILAHPDFSPGSRPFIVYVDSSKSGVGVVLMQEQPVTTKDGQTKWMEVVIAYASKSLTTGEQHYGAYKKELLGVVYALNHFRYYLLGKKFLICTDHRALQWLMNTRSKNNPGLIYRWQDVLSEFDFDIKYVSAAKMTHVDGISRKPYAINDKGNIRDLPEYDTARQSIEDDFWIQMIKTKNINAIDRPQRTRVLPARLRDPNIEVQLPPSLVQNDPPPTASIEQQAIHFDDADDDDNMNPQASAAISDKPMMNEMIASHPVPPTSSRQHQSWDDLNDRMDDLRQHQQKDKVIRVIYDYVRERPTESDFNLKRQLEKLQVAKSITDTIYRNRNRFLMKTNDILHFKTSQNKLVFVVPAAKQVETVAMAHAHEASLHPGIERTMMILADRVWWPDMRRDVKTYISNCGFCINKDRRKAQHVPSLGRTTSKLVPKLSHWSADILSFNQPSGGNTCVLTLMDYATRWAEAYPLPNEKADTLVRTLRKDFASRYGYGHTITTDRGQNFLSKEFEAACAGLHYRHSTTLPYGPQANPVERFHRSLNASLRILLDNQPLTTWGPALHKAILSYRITPSTSGVSPFELLFGCRPTLPIDLYLGIAPSGDTTGDVSSSMGEEAIDVDDAFDVDDNTEANINVIQATAMERHERKVEQRHQQNEKRLQQKRPAKPPVVFRSGDIVNLWRPLDYNDLKRGRKFTRHWSGPYKVVKHDWKLPFRVFISDTKSTWTKDVHINHVRHRGQNAEQLSQWSPFAPTLSKRMIRSGQTPSWITEETKTNNAIPSEHLREANQPPLIDGEWEEDQNITRIYHQAYPNGFPPPQEVQQHEEPQEPEDNDEFMPQESQAVWRGRPRSDSMVSTSTSSTSASSQPSSPSSESTTHSESSDIDSDMDDSQIPNSKGIKRPPTSATKLTPPGKRNKR